MRNNTLGESDNQENDLKSMEGVVDLEEVKEEGSNGLKKNILKLNMLVSKICPDITQRNLYIAGANTPISKYSIENGKNLEETSMPIHCCGMIIDQNGDIWAHNLNNHKLTKFSPQFEILKEWEGNDKVNLGKN